MNRLHTAARVLLCSQARPKGALDAGAVPAPIPGNPLPALLVLPDRAFAIIMAHLRRVPSRWAGFGRTGCEQISFERAAVTATTALKSG